MDRARVKTLIFLLTIVCAAAFLAAAPVAQSAPAALAVKDGGEITGVYRAGNIESLDPPSASAGTDWRMAEP